MRLVELSLSEFEDFASNHPLRSYAQSPAYAKFMGEQGFSYDYIGYDDNGTIIAASLILYKRIGGFQKYAYAPKGFLIDFYNQELVEKFSRDLIKRLKEKGIVFLKINPEIIIGEVKYTDYFTTNYNKNVKIIDDLKDIKYKRRREVEALDFIFPRINGYIDLKKYKQDKLSKDLIKKINYATKRGLSYETATSRQINVFYNIIKEDAEHSINYYRNFLNIFSKENKSEFFLIKVNYREFLIQAKGEYEKELDNNNSLNMLIQEDNTEENLNLKMESDKYLLKLKNNIVEATEGLKKGADEVIGGAIIIKHLTRVTVLVSGFSKRFMHLNPYEFLYDKLCEIYKNEFDYLDLNGLSSDFNPKGKYFNKNMRKLEFKPDIYEYIGEFDYIINEGAFRNLQSRNLIAKEMKNLK